MESRRWVRFINGSARLPNRRMDALTEDQPTVVEEMLAEPRSSPREWWVPLGLVLGGGVWNLLVAPLGDMVDGSEWWTLSIYLAMGTLIVQPLLCALWGACASQAWPWRLMLGTAANCFLALTITTDGDVLNILIFVMGIYVTFLGLLVALHWRFRLVLATQASSRDAWPSNASFGLGYLFAWMSVVAVLTGLARWLAGDAVQSNPAVEEFALLTLMFLALLAPPAWLLLYLLSPTRVQLRSLMGMALSVPVVTLFAALIIGLLAPGTPFWSEGFWPMLSYCLGAMLTVVVVAAALRWAGYRLSTLAPNS